MKENKFITSIHLGLAIDLKRTFSSDSVEVLITDYCKHKLAPIKLGIVYTIKHMYASRVTIIN